jgi:dTDP-glucose 4,6-dehydratase
VRKLNRLLVTGGAGFIGSNFIRYLFRSTGFKGITVNVDSLTYAGNPENLSDIEEEFGGRRYFFEKADICDFDRMRTLVKSRDIDTIIHFAAESHVDRSIFGPGDFIRTNIMGTFALLEAARETWKGRDDVLFHHVSTDEVFGSLGDSGSFNEETPYSPNSPYSASKASSDHLVRATHHTYGLPVTLSNCSNNYGPYQFPEKLIPLAILNILNGKPVPVYGDGKNRRDWLYVEDHCDAVWAVLNRGETGRTYTVGGENEWENIALVNLLCERIAGIKGEKSDAFKGLISFVKDRPGHDRRYAIDCTRIRRELGWKQKTRFAEGVDKTIQWYMRNDEWIRNVQSGGYRAWVEKQYGEKKQS